MHDFEKPTYLELYLELEPDILHAGRGHQYCILVQYERITPSIRDSRGENLEI